MGGDPGGGPAPARGADLEFWERAAVALAAALLNTTLGLMQLDAAEVADKLEAERAARIRARETAR